MSRKDSTLVKPLEWNKDLLTISEPRVEGEFESIISDIYYDAKLLLLMGTKQFCFGISEVHDYKYKNRDDWADSNLKGFNISGFNAKVNLTLVSRKIKLIIFLLCMFSSSLYAKIQFVLTGFYGAMIQHAVNHIKHINNH